ncbi:MAG: hypothetical protein ACPGJI_08900 [Kangiellaceae bacterium]
MSKFLREKLKSKIALVLAVVSILLNLYFIWGALCLFWAFENIKNEETYFVEKVEKIANPILYWIIIGVWLSMGGYYIYYDLVY